MMNRVEKIIFSTWVVLSSDAFSALTLLIGRQECQLGAGMVICLERGADLHLVHMIPSPPALSCLSEIQIGFTFVLLSYPGSSRQKMPKNIS